MVEAEVTTGVDALLELLRGRDKIALLDAAKLLKVSPSTLQSWVDFLVEERIVGIEYKFTKPFIYLNREEKKTSKKGKDLPKLADIKKEYVKNAKEKQIPEDQIDNLWMAHVRQELTSLEPFFHEQTLRRGVENTLDQKRLWGNYSQELLKQATELQEHPKGVLGGK